MFFLFYFIHYFFLFCKKNVGLEVKKFLLLRVAQGEQITVILMEYDRIQ